MRKEPEQNIQLALAAAICRKQDAYRAYKACWLAWLQATWIGDDGNFCYMKGNYAEKAKEAEAEFINASRAVEYYQRKVRSRNENH